MILLLIILAQEPNPVNWQNHNKLANTISNITLGSDITGQVIKSFKSSDRKRALECLAAKNGLTLGSTEIVKLLVHRTRPDGSDMKSFFSGHSAMAAVNSGWNFQVSIPLVFGTGYTRMAANRHFASDVLVGASVGFIFNRVCNAD